MSQIHDGPLATYSSLTDRNLAGYFSNTKMRRHLRKAGLVDKRGQIVSENQYRMNMARKEHKKHVKDLLAQAIVHKTLDIERTRQVEIKRKLEEIAKLELVRRVRASKHRKGDEDILPYLSPRSSRPPSRYRPRSAPADRQYVSNSYDADVIYVDDEGRPVTPPKELEEDNRKEEIDTRHLYALDSAALKKYALTLSKIEQGEGMSSPYLINQAPSPPRSARGSKSSYRDTKYKPRLNRPRTANSLSPYRSTRTGAVQGTLMLHRQEPAMMHQGEVQTLCEVTMKYYGPSLILPRDQRDPRQDVEIEQQHCGGNTLPVFKERIKPGDEFTFISRRHRGYPFSLSIFVEGRISARVSTCCEYGHVTGVRLGGKMGQFCLKKVTGATPCYKCKLNAQASPRTMKRPSSKKKGQKVEEIKEEIIVLRPDEKKNAKDEENDYEEDFEDTDTDGKKDSGTEKYKDDFESDEDTKYRRRSRSSSSSSSSSSSRSRSRSHTPAPIEPEDDTKIIGLKADEDLPGRKRSIDEDSRAGDRKIEGQSDDDEQPESLKWTTGTRQKQGRRSSSSSSSSSSSKSSARSRDSIKRPQNPEPKKQATTYYEETSESTQSDARVSVEAEVHRQQKDEKRRSSSSSSSSSLDEDVKKYKRQLSSEELRKEEHRRTIEKRREEEQQREEERQLKLAKQREEDEIRRETERKEQVERDRIRKEKEEEARQEREEQKRRAEEDKRKAYAERKAQPQFNSFPEMDYIPEPVSYSKMYEEDMIAARQEVEVEKSLHEPNKPKHVVEIEQPSARAKQITSSSSTGTSSESEREKPTSKRVSPIRSQSSKSSSSSTSGSSETETDSSKGKGKVPSPPRTPTPSRVTPPRSIASSSSSSSSSSDSETETDASKSKASAVKGSSPPRTPTPTRVTPPRSRTSSYSSSSSSSDSETETDADKSKPSAAKAPSPPRTPTPTRVTPPRSRSVSSSSSSSSSDSETETDADKTPRTVATVSAPKPASSSTSISESETTTDTDQKPIRQVPTGRTTPIREEKESSSTSSSSDSETDTDNVRKQKTPPKQPSPPPQPIEPVVTTKSSVRKSSSSSSSSDSETETETATETATETETDNEKVKRSSEPLSEKDKLPAITEKEKKSSSSSSGSSGSSSESESEKRKKAEVPQVQQEKKTEEIKDDKKRDTTTTDTSGSSDSSSDSSDSEDEDKKKTAEKMAEILEQKEASTEKETTLNEVKGQVEESHEKTISDEPFISESEGEPKVATTIFDTESDGGNMHGGNDPDNLASAPTEVKSYLTKIGVAPAQPIEGNINYLFDGKKDVEISNIALSASQVEEVTSFISTTNEVSSLCLRNAGIDDDKFGSIAEALKASNAKPMMLNFNLNKMTSGSVDNLVEMLIDRPSIEILLLHGNPLGDEGVKKMVNGILDLHKASFLIENESDPEAKQETKGETTKYCVLKELDLGDTDIGDEGIGYIASLLENESNLKTLNLNGNIKVTYTGWKRLAKSLKKNRTLKSLTLDFNKIGDEGVAALVNSLKVNTCLTTLDLESTGLTEEGGKQLVDLVKCNTTILDVTVQPGNKISEKTQDEIRNYLGLNKAAASKTAATK